MYTQCPECLTIYKIAAESLAGGRGSFRCGHCEGVFDALPTLIDKLPLEVLGELPRHPAPPSPPLLQIPAMHPKPRQASLFDANDGKEVGRIEPGLSEDWLKQLPPTLANAPATSRARYEGRDPRLARLSGAPAGSPRSTAAAAAPAMRSRSSSYSTAAAGGGSGWGWACVLLIATLGGQIAYAERARWIGQPTVRDLSNRVLGWFGERLPPRVDPSALSLQSRDVRPHSTVTGALLITASMLNSSSSVVAFPRVEIRMTDLSGKPVALRRFAPTEYLSDPDAVSTGLEPGAIVPLVFEVLDPGREALNFEFAFRAPS